MHNSRKVFLMDPEPRCLLCSYDPTEGSIKDRSGVFIPKTVEFKTFDPSYNVGDYVVVPTNSRHNMTVVKVEEVDVEPNLDTGKAIDWIIAHVPLDMYDKLLKQESGVVKAISSAEKKKRKQELREAHFSEYDGPTMKLLVNK